MRTLTIIAMGAVLSGCATQTGYYAIETPKITVPIGQDAKYGSIYTYLTFGYVSPDNSDTVGQK